MGHLYSFIQYSCNKFRMYEGSKNVRKEHQTLKELSEKYFDGYALFADGSKSDDVRGAAFYDPYSSSSNAK